MKVSPFAGESRWATLTVFLGCFVPLFVSFAFGAHSSSCPTMMRLIFSRLITNCPHEQRQMRIANANVAKASATTQDNKQQKRKRTEDEGRRRRGKTFGRGPKYLTLQMKWQNVESNAQTAQNVSQRRDAERRGKKPQYSKGQGRAEGGHKDRAKRCDTD